MEQKHLDYFEPINYSNLTKLILVTYEDFIAQIDISIIEIVQKTQLISLKQY